MDIDIPYSFHFFFDAACAPTLALALQTPDIPQPYQIAILQPHELSSTHVLMH